MPDSSTGWRITYNNVGSDSTLPQYVWNNVNIDTFHSETVYADDGRTPLYSLNTLRATALWSPALLPSDSNSAHKILQEMVKLLGTPRQSLIIGHGAGATSTDSTLVNDYALVSSDPHKVSWYATEKLPRVEVATHRIYGTTSVLFGLNITWATVIRPSVTDWEYPILSHTWQWSTSMMENGLSHITVDGMLSLASYVDGADPSIYNPDFYRYLMMPAQYFPGGASFPDVFITGLPVNYRYTNMTFVVSKDGRSIRYQIGATEHARPLPEPASRGTGSFIWKRSLDANASFLGIKVFEAELEGRGMYTNRGDLLTSLLLCAKKRINFAATTGGPADMIQEIVVGEHDIFSRNIVSLRIVAQSMGATSDPNDPTAGLQPPDWRINETLVDQIATPIEPYSNPLVVAYMRTFYNQSSTYLNPENYPRPAWIGSPSEEPPGVTIKAYESSESVGGNDVQHAPGQEVIPNSDHLKYPYLSVAINIQYEINNNLVVLKEANSAVVSRGDVVYQPTRPRVFVKQVLECQRVGKAPEMIMYEPPPGCVIISESSRCASSGVDASNNRIITTVYTRELEIVEGVSSGGTSNRWENVSVSLGGYGTMTFSRWVSLLPEHRVPIPLDPRAELQPGPHFLVPPLNEWNEFILLPERKPVV